MPKGTRTDEYKSVFGNRKKDPGANGKPANWGDVDGGVIKRFIQTCTSRGGACRFGYTRDGGAYALGLYYGSESNTEYCRPNEDVELFLETWIEFYARLPDTNGVSPDNGRR